MPKRYESSDWRPQTKTTCVELVPFKYYCVDISVLRSGFLDRVMASRKWERCATRLTIPGRPTAGSSPGRAIYALRKCTVEPVFGNLKRASFRQFLLRGHHKARGEFLLACNA